MQFIITDKNKVPNLKQYNHHNIYNIRIPVYFICL